MTVFIYVDTSKRVGDPDHLKVFANADAPDIETDDAHRVRNWPSSKSLMMVSRSVASTSASHHARPCRPEALGGRFKVMKSAFIGSTSRLKIFSE
jgi:hypothetical protein